MDHMSDVGTVGHSQNARKSQPVGRWGAPTQVQQNGLHGLVLLHHQVALGAQPMQDGQYLLCKV